MYIYVPSTITILPYPFSYNSITCLPPARGLRALAPPSDEQAWQSGEDPALDPRKTSTTDVFRYSGYLEQVGCACWTCRCRWRSS